MVTTTNNVQIHLLKRTGVKSHWKERDLNAFNWRFSSAFVKMCFLFHFAWGHFAAFVDPFCYLCFVFVMLSCSLKPCGHLLGEGWHLCSPLCNVFCVCFCRLHMWCPVSGGVLDCIDSWSLPSYLLPNLNNASLQRTLNQMNTLK